MTFDMRTTVRAAYCCDVPAELGAVTDLDVSHGRVIAQTASGVPMILPVYQHREAWQGTRSTRMVFDEAPDWPDDGRPLF